MAEAMDPKEVVTINEIAITNMPEIQALIELLEEKGIITKEELVPRIQRIRAKIRGR